MGKSFKEVKKIIKNISVGTGQSTPLKKFLAAYESADTDVRPLLLQDSKCQSVISKIIQNITDPNKNDFKDELAQHIAKNSLLSPDITEAKIDLLPEIFTSHAVKTMLKVYGLTFNEDKDNGTVIKLCNDVKEKMGIRYNPVTDFQERVQRIKTTASDSEKFFQLILIWGALTHDSHNAITNDEVCRRKIIALIEPVTNHHSSDHHLPYFKDEVVVKLKNKIAKNKITQSQATTNIDSMLNDRNILIPLTHTNRNKKLTSDMLVDFYAELKRPIQKQSDIISKTVSTITGTSRSIAKAVVNTTIGKSESFEVQAAKVKENKEADKSEDFSTAGNSSAALSAAPTVAPQLIEALASKVAAHRPQSMPSISVVGNNPPPPADIPTPPPARVSAPSLAIAVAVPPPAGNPPPPPPSGAPKPMTGSLKIKKKDNKVEKPPTADAGALLIQAMEKASIMAAARANTDASSVIDSDADDKNATRLLTLEIAIASIEKMDAANITEHLQYFVAIFDAHSKLSTTDKSKFLSNDNTKKILEAILTAGDDRAIYKKNKRFQDNLAQALTGAGIKDIPSYKETLIPFFKTNEIQKIIENNKIAKPTDDELKGLKDQIIRAKFTSTVAAVAAPIATVVATPKPKAEPVKAETPKPVEPQQPIQQQASQNITPQITKKIDETASTQTHIQKEKLLAAADFITKLSTFDQKVRALDTLDSTILDQFKKQCGNQLTTFTDAAQSMNASPADKDKALDALVTASQGFLDGLRRDTAEQNAKATRTYNIVTGIITAAAFLIGAVVAGAAITLLTGGTLTIPYLTALSTKAIAITAATAAGGGLTSGAMSFGLFRCFKPEDKVVDQQTIDVVDEFNIAATNLVKPKA